MTDAERKAIIKYRLSRAHETLNEVDILIKNQLWNTAVNRLYYACYYAVNALLISLNIKAQTHSGVRQMFGSHFIKTGKINKDLGKFYSILFDKRMAGDYDDFVNFNHEEVSVLYSTAQQFIKEIDKIIGY
ncbi:HEPN domain-containing protein [Candidatus Sulfidibacterium hydrothermale]|uniref:HEPN domain-containing protein n=1 Tax=Candidatus Sulfidibacterium hydrothermale TaxID=2875962 RepID=UPI001F0AD960|nr:HEPN domain-containing protein [Candidatus Sulfidibacterium hydrothermale]UBM61111.1 HEPN domain-containing protein [Candidatus Sulfidibacterium hydrothermale]